MSTGVNFLQKMKDLSCLFDDCQIVLDDLFLQKVQDENLNKFYAWMIAMHTDTKLMEQNFTLCCVGVFLWYIMPSIWYTQIFREVRISV